MSSNNWRRRRWWWVAGDKGFLLLEGILLLLCGRPCGANICVLRLVLRFGLSLLGGSWRDSNGDGIWEGTGDLLIGRWDGLSGLARVTGGTYLLRSTGLEILDGAPEGCGALDEDLTKACLRALEARDPADCRRWAENFSWEAASRQFIANLEMPGFDEDFWLRSAKMID